MLSMINPAAVAPSPYLSQGAMAANPQRLLFISGQVGVDKNGRVGADIAEQSQLAAANLNSVLTEAGMDGSNLAKLTIYLTDGANLPGFSEAAAPALPSPPPAITVIIVKALAGPDLLVEIEGFAVA